MIGLGQQLSIIAHEARIEIMGWGLVALAVLCGIIFIAWLYGVCSREVRRVACIVGAGGIAFLGVMTIKATDVGGSKEDTPRIAWDVGLKDNGSTYTSTGGEKDGVQFVWRKTNPDLPDTQELEFLRRTKGATSEDWTVVGISVVGSLSQTFSIESPDSYEYYVCHDWVPPSPVHTNGVWIGSVVERAKGSAGAEKMVIIHGKLIKDGVVIAPEEVK